MKEIQKENLRWGRGAKKRVFPEGLKRDPPKKLGHTISLKPIMILGTIVDKHDHHKHGNVSHNYHGNQPWSPLTVWILHVICCSCCIVSLWVPLVSVLSCCTPLQISIPHHSLQYVQTYILWAIYCMYIYVYVYVFYVCVCVCEGTSGLRRMQELVERKREIWEGGGFFLFMEIWIEYGRWSLGQWWYIWKLVELLVFVNWAIINCSVWQGMRKNYMDASALLPKSLYAFFRFQSLVILFYLPHIANWVLIIFSNSQNIAHFFLFNRKHKKVLERAIENSVLSHYADDWISI